MGTAKFIHDLRKVDVHCRKLLRRAVGPPADIDWNQPWHTILHARHRRIDQQLEYGVQNVGQRNVCPNVAKFLPLASLGHLA